MVAFNNKVINQKVYIWIYVNGLWALNQFKNMGSNGYEESCL